MRKLKLVSLTDAFKIADYDRLEREKNTKAQMLSDLQNARQRARDGHNQPRAQPSEAIVQYAKEQSLSEWFNSSPFIGEIKKAHTVM
ncbi:hypothetical protein ACFO26_07050 [Lactococcus nasutitermitis]|uniref:Uncharacterized protein n=1 Tax=Lactococcus nasutitermitis TaxID=1652957 RepID=A0ABV9JDB1_9LACT|nr:hypothetical protein [Lactococcus nasutitermitis]